ncbi:MAG: hypothetical protein V3S29_08385, partial [bacterium]
SFTIAYGGKSISLPTTMRRFPGGFESGVSFGAAVRVADSRSAIKITPQITDGRMIYPGWIFISVRGRFASLPRRCLVASRAAIGWGLAFPEPMIFPGTGG